MMSMPLSYMPRAISCALSGALKPVKSPSGVMYLTWTVASLLAALTPATKPASNFLISVFSTPPMKPIFLVLVLSPAAAPTRNEPCSSAKTSEVTFGAETVEPTIAYWTDGFAFAESVRGVVQRNPTPITRALLPVVAASLMRGARSDSPVDGGYSFGAILKSLAARSRPQAAESLND